MDTNDLVKDYIESKPDFPIKSKLISTHKLSGGLVNYVYRLKFEDGSTAILKYYPEFIAVNKSVRMSQKRYFVEKKALELLSVDEELTKNSIVRVPRVFFTDDNSHILIMEDAGENSKTLFENLKNSHSSAGDDKLFNRLAKELHYFSSYLSNKSNIKPDTHSDPFDNKAARDVIDTYVKGLYSSQSKLLDIEKEMEPYLKDSEIMEKEASEKREKKESVLVFGDLWPNSILIDSDRNLIWLIDWEMARFENSYRDLDQLVCNLWVMKQNPSLFNVAKIDKLIKNLQLEFFGDENQDWRLKCGKHGKTSFIMWVVMLLNEKHWEINDSRQAALRAFEEVAAL